MRAKLLVAMFGGAILGAALAHRMPLITVIVNVGNQGSIDIKVDNTTSAPHYPTRQVTHSEHASEGSDAASQSAESAPPLRS